MHKYCTSPCQIKFQHGGGELHILPLAKLLLEIDRCQFSLGMQVIYNPECSHIPDTIWETQILLDELFFVF